MNRDDTEYGDNNNKKIDNLIEDSVRGPQVDGKSCFSLEFHTPK